MDERVAQGASNAMDLQEKIQDRVDGQGPLVNQAVIVVGGGTEEDSSSLGDGHEELVLRGTSHAESGIEGCEQCTPTSM